MNKKQKMWLALLCLLFWTCTDLSPFGDSEELVHDSDPALVKLAKEMLQRSKYELSLPDIHKHHSGSASTRSIKYDTDVSPLWDKARSYQHGESKTLLVPLRSADEIRSRIALRRGSDVTYQFAKAKSFLVLQQVKGYTISRVMTYLPESSYAEEHVSALDTIGYNAGAIGFHGLSIVSKIDGTFSHAFLYEHGKITRQFIRNAHLHCNHEHGEECHHESDSSTYEHTYLTIDLYTPSSLTRGGYDDGNENGNDVCPDCGKFSTDCFCIYDKFCYFCQKPNEECTCDGAVIEGERCNECGEYLQYCVCCRICGFHPCQCDDQYLCPTCKKEPCECTSGSQGGKGDGKEEGGGGNNGNSSGNILTPCRAREKLNKDSSLNQRLQDYAQQIAIDGYENGWVRTSDGTINSPSERRANGLSYVWNDIQYDVIEWFHTHPNGGLFPNREDLITICYRERLGYIKKYEEFMYGVIATSTMSILTVVDKGKFKAFANSLGNAQNKEKFIKACNNIYEDMNTQTTTTARIALYLQLLEKNDTGLNLTFRDYNYSDKEWNDWGTKQLINNNVENVICD